jgi:hypothetical protein
VRDLVDDTSTTQQELLWALMSQLDPGQRLEALKGAHFEIADQGALYDLFVPNGSYPRTSSHEKQTGDHGLDLPGGGTILIARDKRDSTITHVQFERHGARSHPLEHMVDWCEGGQLGPYGESVHTDKNPIKVPK